MKRVLRFCLGLALTIEILVWLGIIATLSQPKKMAGTEGPWELVGALFLVGAPVIQIFLYRYIGSSWEKMGRSTKALAVVLVIAPLLFILYFTAQALAYIIGSILLLVVIGFGLAGQGKYNRTMRDAETRGNIDEIRRKLGDINSKL